MNEIIDPKNNPELAAQQVIIELIRVNNFGEVNASGLHRNVDVLLSIHTKLVSHYKNMK